MDYMAEVYSKETDKGIMGIVGLSKDIKVSQYAR
jgi:hypothetical protein